ncbi:MAG: DUF3788 family protein [Clostridiaceae bacterium]|nr:DUF3788 family protein [Clostridiaceae bacterium]
MKTTKEQLLRNPDIQPSSDVIAKALNEANNTYIKFANELINHNIEIEWRYYTDGKAWLAKGLYKWKGVRGVLKETTVFWLSVWDGFFKLTIFIPEKNREDALNLPLSDDINKMISESKQMGKLKFFPVVFDLYSDELLPSVFTLLDFTKNIK